MQTEIMLVKYSSLKHKLNLIRTNQIKESYKVGIDGIDKYIRFKPSNFNIILGHSNVGKTTCVLYLMLLYSRRLGVKWLVFSSENEPHSIVRKLLEFQCLKPLNKLTEEEFDKNIKFIEDRFKILDTSRLFNYRQIIELATSLKQAWDYQGLLIDPYNSLVKDPELVRGIGGHEYDYQACTEMRIFCKSNKVSIWLNTHANTNALRMKHPIGHEYAGHPIVPLASDVEGGGKFVNRADDFICIHRYLQHETEWMVSMIHVRKIKEIETGGQPTPLDDPIKMRSMPGNVGFSINGEKMLDTELKDKHDLPF